MAIGFIPIIFIILLVAFGLGLAVYEIYKHKVNKALKEGDSIAHISVPDPLSSSRSIATAVIIILLIVLLINQNSKITALKNDLINLQNNIDINNAQLTESIDDFGKKLLNESKRLMELDYCVIGFDNDSSKYVIEYTATLKEYSPDTQLTLYMPCGGKIEMDKSDEYCFRGTTEFGIDDKINYSDPYVVIRDGDIIQTEMIGYVDDKVKYPMSLIDVLNTNKIYLDNYPNFDHNNFDFSCCTIEISKSDNLFLDVVTANISLIKNGKTLACIDFTQEYNEHSNMIIELANKGFSGLCENGDKVDLIVEIQSSDGFLITNLVSQIDNSKDIGFRFINYYDEAVSVSRNGDIVYSIWPK